MNICFRFLSRSGKGHLKTNNLLFISQYRFFFVLYLLFLTLVIGMGYGQGVSEKELLIAAQKGELGQVQTLIEKGVSPNLKDTSGRTPLHLATANGHQATAEFILLHGGNINAQDTGGNTPLDLAVTAGHSALSQFLISKGGIRKNLPGNINISGTQTRSLKPSLKFKTLPDFQKEIREPAVLLESPNICFFAPKRREQEARIIFNYLVKAYDELYQVVGTHTNYKIAVYAFPKGNPNGWGGTSDCSIEYDDSNLDLASQPEWVKYHIPHVSGYIEEMAHNFVHTTQAQFGWEMVGWSLGMEVSQKVAGNPIMTENLRATRGQQQKTFNQYVQNGYRVPKELPANLCDRIHAWLLYQCRLKYGPLFWHDVFVHIRQQKPALAAAAQLGDGDQIRNQRYQITIACFDQLPGLEFKKHLSNLHISLKTDVKSLHPESPGWNRQLTE